MGGGNGQKAKMARERNLEKLKGQKGISILYCVFMVGNWDHNLFSSYYLIDRKCVFDFLCRKSA